MISALCWVPKGAAKAMPDVAEPSPEELEALREQAEQAALEGGLMGSSQRGHVMGWSAEAGLQELHRRPGAARSCCVMQQLARFNPCTPERTQGVSRQLCPCWQPPPRCMHGTAMGLATALR